MFHHPKIGTTLNIKLALFCFWTLFCKKRSHSTMKCTRKANAATTFLEYSKSGENRHPTMQKPMLNILLSDMAIKTCHLAAFSSLFYHIFDLHAILLWLEYDPTMSQQCTTFRLKWRQHHWKCLRYIFHLGLSKN